MKQKVPSILLLLFTMVIPGVLYSQQDSTTQQSEAHQIGSLARATWGNPIHDSRQYQLIHFIGIDKSTGNSLWLGLDNGIYLLEKFDPNNNRILSKEIDLQKL